MTCDIKIRGFQINVWFIIINYALRYKPQQMYNIVSYSEKPQVKPVIIRYLHS